MVNLDLQDCRELLESKDPPDQRDLKDTEVSLVSRACLVPLDLLEREGHLERMERTESPALLAQGVHQDWMELLDQWVILDRPDPEECRERRASEGHQESLVPPDLQVQRENLLVLTWPHSLL